MPRGITWAAAIAAAGLMLPATSAGASEFVAVQLGSSTGEGSFNDTIGCPGGDGPSWRYHYAGEATPGVPRFGPTPEDGPLGGTWTSTIAVHEGQGGTGYVPAGQGKIVVDATRGGTARFDVDGGDCENTQLGVSRDGDDAQAQGSLPVTATGGTGATRGLTGTGHAETYLELGAGAGNYGFIVLTGEFDVPDPQPRTTQATAKWSNLADYLNGRLTITATVANPAAAGDAFELKLTQAPGYTPAPQSLGTLRGGAARTFTLRLANARPGQTYSLPTTLTSRDGLGVQMPPVTSTVTFRAPATP